MVKRKPRLGMLGRMSMVLLGWLALRCVACFAEAGPAPATPSRAELGKLLGDKNAHLRAYAVYNMAYRFPEDAPRLVAFASDPHPAVRRAAIFSLGLFRFEAWTELFIEALNDKDYGVRRAAVFALGSVKTLKALEAVAGAFRDADPGVRQLAILAIGRAGDRKHVPGLISLLRDGNPRVRRAAACALGMLDDSSALAPLRRLYADRKNSEPGERVALANIEAEKALSKKVNLDYKFLYFGETVEKLSEAAGVEIRVDDEVLFMLNTSAKDAENLNSIRLAMWNVPFEKALGKVVQTAGARYFVESGAINISSMSYEAYDTPVSLEAAAAMAFLGDRSALGEVRKFLDDARFGKRARELLRAATR